MEREKIPELIPPAAMFPHGKLSNSPTGIACDTTGKFGPFKNQLFVGEQTMSTVLRVALEKVNGVYQGAAFPFRGRFKSGNVAVRLGPDGSMFVEAPTEDGVLEEENVSLLNDAISTERHPLRFSKSKQNQMVFKFTILRK